MNEQQEELKDLKEMVAQQNQKINLLMKNLENKNKAENENNNETNGEEVLLNHVKENGKKIKIENDSRIETENIFLKEKIEIISKSFRDLHSSMKSKEEYITQLENNSKDYNL